ncbi:hypothetical protein [Thermus hydrothermalis]|uniref:hypothetical protein n=1 Tax=Thermus hydrothermalis TaxID=2908148 RepID=UPI001FAB2594|nr:hypothetical protein [Thermus hydrothermalis]
MAQETRLVEFTPLELASWSWSELKDFLGNPEDYNPDEVLALIEEFPCLKRYLRRAYQDDPEPALALAREILAERERLSAHGIRVPETLEALLGLTG